MKSPGDKDRHDLMRQRINLNREWKFSRGDPAGAQAPAFDDSAWETVGLPHTFDLPYFRTPEFYVGVGWYRKRIDTRPLWPGGKHYISQLEFDGAFQVADVFINGEKVGEHRGGYTGFVTRGPPLGTSTLAIRVSNEWNPQLCPRAGEHIFSGGLYRDVYLTFPDSVHVPRNGISITTAQVSRDSAIVRVKADVQNASALRRRTTVRHTIVAPDGTIVATFESTQSIAPSTMVTFDLTSPRIERPMLWHPDQPHLYTLQTTLFRDDGDPVDLIETEFGIRRFEWTADRGFFLNGEHLYLRGANVHQDRAGWGIAGTQSGAYRDVKLMKDAGFNFVRGSHYPHHPAFADACDHLGLLYLPENCFWGKGGFGPEGYWNASAYPVNPEDFEPFEAHCKQTLREMIAAEQNHPSIIGWSMTNEAFFTYNLDRARGLIKDLVTLTHELDPTRPAVIGGAQRGDVDKLGDVAGYNGDGARLFIDPGMPNMVSEYGAISKPHDAYDAFFGELQQEQFPWRSGQAIWCGFDYGTIAGRQGLKGIVDHYRLPKRSWYWYRNEYLKIPPPAWPEPGAAAKLRLSADKTTIQGTDATDDCQIVVTVLDATGKHISNSPAVTLSIESGPGEFPVGPTITFDAETDIKIVDGQAAIELRSYYAGTTVLRATSAGLEDATITIMTIGEPAFVEGVTPSATPRPYAPPVLSHAAIMAAKNIVNVARDRPSRASSEAEAHHARFANDGDESTLWVANAVDVEPWWQVDLEGFYQISGSRIVFPGPSNWRYTIKISTDGITWTTAVDRAQTDRSDAVRSDIFPPGSVARYVRLAGIMQLSEVEVHGVLSLR